jgi:hypothetical protein
LGEVVAGEAATVVGQRESNNEYDADQGGGEAEHGNEDAVAETVAEPAAEDQGDDFDGAAGGAVEEGL